MRRRRPDAFRNSPPWPGKARDQAREEAQYDHCLMVDARMLEVHVPDKEPSPGQPLPPEQRAVLEDRLAGAGLDGFAFRAKRRYDVVGHDDPVFGGNGHVCCRPGVVDRWRAQEAPSH